MRNRVAAFRESAELDGLVPEYWGPQELPTTAPAHSSKIAFLSGAPSGYPSPALSTNSFLTAAWPGLAKAAGLDAVFYHTWYLVPTSDGCQMITEEVVYGPGAIAFRDKDPSAMHRGHEAWLNGLKQVSEKMREEGGVQELQEFGSSGAPR